MDFYLGCDVSKSKIDVALVNDQGSLLWQDTVENNTTSLATYLLTLTAAYQNMDIVGVVESTGRYHYPLLDAALATNFNCLLYNPILTKQLIRTTVRSKKTDHTDAILIARLGLRGEGRLYTAEPYLDTKLQTRSYEKLTQWRHSLLEHTAYLKDLSDTVMTNNVIEVFENIEAAIGKARRELYGALKTSAAGEVFDRLQTIPGVGPLVASCVIGEVQDMNRFTRAKYLIAFIGFDPKIRQSGHSLNSTGKLSKRGSPHLRRSLFLAAHVARRNDPYFKALYDKKRAEGKTYKVATCAVTRKLITVVRAVWLSGQDYDTSFWERPSHCLTKRS